MQVVRYIACILIRIDIFSLEFPDLTEEEFSLDDFDSIEDNPSAFITALISPSTVAFSVEVKLKTLPLNSSN